MLATLSAALQSSSRATLTVTIRDERRSGSEAVRSTGTTD
jgi:hypothetical protein